MYKREREAPAVKDDAVKQPRLELTPPLVSYHVRLNCTNAPSKMTSQMRSGCFHLLRCHPKTITTLRLVSVAWEVVAHEMLLWAKVFSNGRQCVLHIPCRYLHHAALRVELPALLAGSPQFHQCAAYLETVSPRLIMCGASSTLCISCIEPSDFLSRWLQIATTYFINLNLAAVTDAGISGLEKVATLEELNLRSTAVTNVTLLSSCKALKKLDLCCSKVTDAGICGLEKVATLEELNLCFTPVTSVALLSSCKALKKLDLRGSEVTDTGIYGLQKVATLEELNLRSTAVTNVTLLSSCKALKKLDLCCFNVTDAGIRGLEKVATLEELDLRNTAVPRGVVARFRANVAVYVS